MSGAAVGGKPITAKQMELSRVHAENARLKVDMARIEFHRKIERPASILLLVSAALWIFVTVQGNTFSGFELSLYAASVGCLVLLAASVPFAWRNVEALPGLMGPVKRVVLLCLNASLLGGLVFGAFALAINRYFPTSPATEQIMVVKEVCKQRGGWELTLEAPGGGRYSHTFPSSFSQVPVDARIKFRMQTGVLGYPYFHSYEHVR